MTTKKEDMPETIRAWDEPDDRYWCDAKEPGEGGSYYTLNSSVAAQIKAAVIEAYAKAEKAIDALAISSLNIRNDSAAGYNQGNEDAAEAIRQLGRE